MSHFVPKHEMTEEDIKLQFITPAIMAKWPTNRITMETKITDGKINLRGNMVFRQKPKKADYVLYINANNPIAIVEAKDNIRSKNDLSSRTQPAAHRRYAVLPQREPGSDPSEPQRDFQVRTDYLRWEGFHLFATCRLPEVPQSRSSSADLEQSCRARGAGDGCCFPWRQGQSRDRLLCP